GNKRLNVSNNSAIFHCVFINLIDPSHIIFCNSNMSNPEEKYRTLGLRESLQKVYQYPIACKELSSILRGAYNKLPKNLQSLIFQDTLTAFHLLPDMQTSSAVAAAHLLLQSAEAALPKQKRNLAVTQFKHAMVAHKRRCKSRQEVKEGSTQLPQDVLVHIFSLLDMQTLVSVGLVCWSWNLAARDNYLWRSQYVLVFGDCDNCSKTTGSQSSILMEDKGCAHLQDDIVPGTSIDWREAFKRAYAGSSSRSLNSNRGYCERCNMIFWLNHKCYNGHCRPKSTNEKIKRVLPHQVVGYLLDDDFLMATSSDSDSESDEELISKLWAQPRKNTKRS
ncbi:F-box-like domain-containing protein, partial [Cephalotus follicularis]